MFFIKQLINYSCKDSYLIKACSYPTPQQILDVLFFIQLQNSFFYVCQMYGWLKKPCIVFRFQHCFTDILQRHMLCSSIWLS